MNRDENRAKKINQNNKKIKKFEVKTKKYKVL